MMPRQVSEKFVVYAIYMRNPRTSPTKTNPSELQSVAQAGFRKLSSLCNLDALATPGHGRAQDEPLRARAECCPDRFHKTL